MPLEKPCFATKPPSFNYFIPWHYISYYAAQFALHYKERELEARISRTLSSFSAIFRGYIVIVYLVTLFALCASRTYPFIIREG